ncbi:MAG: histidine kinase [Ferruginibacter sp.]
METAIITTSLLLLLLVAFIISFVFIHKNKQLTYKKEKQLLQSQYAQSLLQTQIEIQEQTLKTISQEIHDNVGQVLSLAKLNLNTLDVDTGSSRQEKIAESIRLVSKAISDLRDLSRSINGEKISDLGLQEAIQNELRIINNTGLVQATLSIEGAIFPLQNQTEMVIFRIVQEALSNALKHSKAKNISVQIIYEPAGCSITIADDGQGFDANLLEATQTGIGLKNMQNRAKMIDVLFSIDSWPGLGTKIHIRVLNKTS